MCREPSPEHNTCSQARRRAREGIAALAQHVVQVHKRVGDGLDLVLVAHDRLQAGGKGHGATSETASQPRDRLLVVAPGGRSCLKDSLRQVLTRVVDDAPARDTTTTVLTNDTETKAHFQRPSRKTAPRPVSELQPVPGTAVSYRGAVVHRCAGASALRAAQPLRPCS